MYYYDIQDANGTTIKQSTLSYDTGDDAANAAKDDLATMYVPDYPVEVRIYDKPHDETYRYPSSTYYLSEEDIRQHAHRRVEEANRQEFIVIIADAQINSDYYKNTFSEGRITPLDYARYQASLWIKAQYDIESKG